MDFQILLHIVEELNPLLAGARVERIHEGVDGGVYFVFRKDGKNSILLLSPDRSMPRIHLITSKPAFSDSPHGFVQFLRSHLPGKRVTGVRILNQDRVAEISFSQLNVSYRMIFELIGSSANLVLADDSGTILSVYYFVPHDGHSGRLLLPGVSYVYPLHRASAAGSSSAWREPGLAQKNEGKINPKEPAPNRTAELFYERLVEQRRTDRLRAEIAATLRRIKAKVERRIGALSTDRGSAERADEYRLAGDMILANLHFIERGRERVELTGYDGRTIAVGLDPARSPSENAAIYFKKYKKSRIGFALIKKRIEEAERESAFLQARTKELECADDREALMTIRSALAANGYIRHTEDGKRKEAESQAQKAFRTVICRGWQILIGRNAAGNDHITMKLAQPDDLWLHAEGMPGSHVLVKNPGKGEIPPEVLVRAASLAAFHSKGKKAGKVPVTFTRARFVRKPKGAKPGAVVLSERKSIMVVPEEENA